MTSNYCRLCAKETHTENLLNNATIESNFANKILISFNLNINDDERLPRAICSTCHGKAESFFDFTEEIQEAQKTLKAIFIRGEEIKYSSPVNGTDHSETIPISNHLKTEDSLDSFDHSISSETNFTKNIVKPLRKREKKNSKPKVEIRKNRPSLEVWKNYKWKCVECTESIASAKHLRRHAEIHGKPVQYVCAICSKIYNHRKFGAFYKHISAHVNKFKYRCEICGKYSHRKEIHEQHIKTHSNETGYTCKVCGKSYKTASYLRYHSQTHSNLENKYKFSCTVCDKTFTTNSALSYHKKIHTGNRELKYCDQCGKGFTAKSNLHLHIKTQHSEARPYHCEQCPKMFKSLPNLHTHLKVHRGLKQHSCDVCGRSFSTKSILKRHYSIHTGVLPFECEFCNKRFRIQQFLKIHLRQHTGERPFRCEECNHYFANSSNYIKHMKGKHGVQSIAKNPVNRNIKYNIEDNVS